jgi:hypothetical protein
MDDEIVVVRRQWNNWVRGKVRIADFRRPHWRSVSGGVSVPSPRPFVYGYIFCDQLVDGTVNHSCQHGAPPHKILLCVVRGITTSRFLSAFAMRLIMICAPCQITFLHRNRKIRRAKVECEAPPFLSAIWSLASKVQRQRRIKSACHVAHANSRLAHYPRRSEVEYRRMSVGPLGATRTMERWCDPQSSKETHEKPRPKGKRAYIVPLRGRGGTVRP